MDHTQYNIHWTYAWINLYTYYYKLMHIYIDHYLLCCAFILQALTTCSTLCL